MSYCYDFIWTFSRNIIFRTPKEGMLLKSSNLQGKFSRADVYRHVPQQSDGTLRCWSCLCYHFEQPPIVSVILKGDVIANPAVGQGDIASFG
jgi:hypothetical protein